ncbi:Uncharacterised protein [Moraxella lacunata]|uniref:Uncharacterized protein n=1 Tax=Moraxella lacunata TaxID=477 RepID=A0A378TUP8_MORLA|nr:Uncharacterised protein [Moraxella lacunata]
MVNHLMTLTGLIFATGFGRGVLSTPCIVISSKGVQSQPLQTRGKHQVGWVYYIGVDVSKHKLDVA